jgi:DNA transformation protein
MIAEDIEDFFAPFLRVNLKRMFGGHGIYAEGCMVALEADGELFLKVDRETRSFFESQGSSPFTYEKKAGKQMVMSYYRVPLDAYDDDALRERCIREALGAAQRAPLPKKKATKKR